MVIFIEPILNLPIYQLPLSAEFKGITEILGFHTLSDLLQHHTRDLEGLPGLDLDLIYEYVTFLENQGLGNYVDPV